MIISQPISWQSVNWPLDGPAEEYAIFENGNTLPPSYTTMGGATTATVQYDDAGTGVVFIIRPTDGTNYGPSQTVVLSPQPMDNRAWVRVRVRKLMADRTDTPEATIPNLPDDELNDYINDAIRNYSLHCPLQSEATISCAYQVRDYALPSDFYKIDNVMYQRTTMNFKLYLKEKSFKGGESTATSWFGYPKLGIIQPPPGGRFYGGNFDIWEGEIHIDYDPFGDGDTLVMRYSALLPYPPDDITPIEVPEEDMEMLITYVEAKAWFAIEAQDVLLSRWRTREDGGRRDDLPTDKISTRLFNAWNQWIQERRTLRPRQLRLVRR